MKLLQPKGTLTQPFEENYNSSYAESGLKGHTGEDYCVGYNQPLIAVIEAPVYSILNQFNQDTDKYRAIYQIYDDGEYAYEISYGHIKDAFVKVGDTPQAGQMIATEGNYGLCYSNGIKVSPEQKATGKGSHLHFQIRRLIKTKNKNEKGKYIYDARGKLCIDKTYFLVEKYDNGYWGCIDPKQFYGFEFTRDLKYGEESSDIVKLQTALNKLGYFKQDFFPRYGNATKSAVFAFQQDHTNLSWYERYIMRGSVFGRKSREAMNKLLNEKDKSI